MEEKIPKYAKNIVDILFKDVSIFKMSSFKDEQNINHFYINEFDIQQLPSKYIVITSRRDVDAQISETLYNNFKKLAKKYPQKFGIYLQFMASGKLFLYLKDQLEMFLTFYSLMDPNYDDHYFKYDQIKYFKIKPSSIFELKFSDLIEYKSDKKRMVEVLEIIYNNFRGFPVKELDYLLKNSNFDKFLLKFTNTSTFNVLLLQIQNGQLRLLNDNEMILKPDLIRDLLKNNKLIIDNNLLQIISKDFSTFIC